MKKLILSALGILTLSTGFAQQQDKATFIEAKPGYYQNTIMKGIATEEEKDAANKNQTYMKMDISGMDVPTSVDEFTTYWRNNPISQGNTGTCWSFSTTSYFEAEINRQTKQQIKLSELFTVYWEYVEKARYFVQTRGTSNFDEGSEANGVVRIMKMYGAMPMDAYDGLQDGRKIHNHAKMADEMRTYLNAVKANAAWDEETVLKTIKGIMDHYVGTPASTFNYNGKNYNPKSFLNEVCKLNPNDYIDVCSLMEKPYWTTMEYKVPDNWWHNSDYHNVPLDVFMNIVNTSIKKGYSLTIGGDVSEPGFNISNVCQVPSWDIPSAAITPEARQFRFYNHTTTDDHGMHLVGYLNKNGKVWYLVKDSGAGSRNVGTENKNFGYYFFSEDYVKLKIMDVLVHKDMLQDYMSNFKH